MIDVSLVISLLSLSIQFFTFLVVLSGVRLYAKKNGK